MTGVGLDRSAAGAADGLGGLTTEGRRPDLADLDLRSTADLVALMGVEDATVPLAVATAAEQIAAVVDAVAGRMRGGGRLIYVGAGSAGRIGQMDAAEIVPTFGVDSARVIGLLAGGRDAATTAQENVEDDAAAGADAVAALAVGPADSVIGVAASGRTPYTLGALRSARRAGAFTAALVCNHGSPMAEAAEVALEVVVGAEVIAGSTRLKAGTAQKLVLNTISTLVMVRLGKTYGDLMVDVRPTNEKLRVRARRIVAQAAGCDERVAAAALDDAGGRTRVAIVHLLTGVSIAAAAELTDSHDSLRAAVEAGRG